MDLHNCLSTLKENILSIANKSYPELTEENKKFLDSAAQFYADKGQNGGKYIACFICPEILEEAQKKNPLLRVYEFEQAFSLELYLSNSDFTYLYHQNGGECQTAVDVARLMHKDNRMSMFITADAAMIDEFLKMFD